MAPRTPRVGRWTSPSTAMRPMPAIDRAISADSLTRLTRRTVPGSFTPNNGVDMACPTLEHGCGRGVRQIQADSGGEGLIGAPQDAVGRAPHLLQTLVQTVTGPLGVR